MMVIFNFILALASIFMSGICFCAVCVDRVTKAEWNRTMILYCIGLLLFGIYSIFVLIAKTNITL